jgi:hypothetical protein
MAGRREIIGGLLPYPTFDVDNEKDALWQPDSGEGA